MMLLRKYNLKLIINNINICRFKTWAILLPLIDLDKNSKIKQGIYGDDTKKYNIEDCNSVISKQDHCVDINKGNNKNILTDQDIIIKH
jgi:hypothetical protein